MLQPFPIESLGPVLAGVFWGVDAALGGATFLQRMLQPAMRALCTRILLVALVLGSAYRPRRCSGRWTVLAMGCSP
jgi:hypothetical protein